MKGEGEKRAVLLGAVIGAFSGAALAVLYRRWGRRRQMKGAKPISAKQAIRLGAAIATVLRQFIELIS